MRLTTAGVSLFFFFVVLSAASVAIPGIPHQFYGDAAFTQDATVDGLSVEARIGDESVAATLITDGKYGYEPFFLYVPDPENDRAGSTITFYIAGIDTGQTAVFENNGYTRINLSAEGAITDVTRQEGETIMDMPFSILPSQPMKVTLGQGLSIEITSAQTTTGTLDTIKRLDDPFFADKPLDGKVQVAGYEIKITGDVSIRVTIHYNVNDLEENTITPFMHDGTDWVEIVPYTINKAADTVTFNVGGNTPYALFAAKTPAVAAATTGSSSGGTTRSSGSSSSIGSDAMQQQDANDESEPMNASAPADGQEKTSGEDAEPKSSDLELPDAAAPSITDDEDNSDDATAQGEENNGGQAKVGGLRGFLSRLFSGGATGNVAGSGGESGTSSVSSLTIIALSIIALITIVVMMKRRSIP
ncbi:MAG: hypothetical protein ABIC95_05830 [archaeon]